MISGFCLFLHTIHPAQLQCLPTRFPASCIRRAHTLFDDLLFAFEAEGALLYYLMCIHRAHFTFHLNSLSKQTQPCHHHVSTSPILHKLRGQDITVLEEDVERMQLSPTICSGKSDCLFSDVLCSHSEPFNKTSVKH